MWNYLGPYILRLFDMWNRLAAYILRLLGRNDPSPGLENEVSGNINPCSQLVAKEADLGIATGSDFDVFLSFRGPDTRYGFVDCLYEFMRNAGIRIFKDDEELQPGERISKILQAVKLSQLYIPIFSKDYSSSKWCLRELTCMVEYYHRSSGKEILPIFYHVDPSDVKHETNLYKSILRKHEKEQDRDVVKRWKEALKTVATIKGWHLKDQREGVVINDVVQKVLQKITTKKRTLPPNLIGIDDRIEAIKKVLHCDSSDVRSVIIYGLGGIGKTTLAKAVFNELCPQFESHSFLSRESSPCGGTIEMQRKLLADLFGVLFHETSDFEEGNNMIRRRLHNKQVLLVFDGMDENDQFMQLAKNCTSCGPGSKIIITTRDKSVFPITKVEGFEESISTKSTEFFLYEMKEMHFDHALQLFNKLAFNRNLAPPDFYDLSRKVVELTGGLPLALEVIGSHLRSQSKVKWISTLEKLKEVPPKEVQQSLKISYDALECRTKEIFLDIACFFVNKKRTNPMYMWEDCGFFPKVEIDVLLDKSLIKIVDLDRIWMHDQLKTFGRDIIRQEKMRKPEDHSRSWFLEMAHEKGTDNVVAVSQRRSGHNFTRKDFVNLTNAKFLKLDGGNFAGNFEDILSELRWLCWRNCPPELEANNFVLNHLVVLKLSGDIIIEKWSRWVEIMVASKLKVLEIAGSTSLIETPCFSEFMNLERLVLKDFPRLAKIDDSIGKLERLTYLKIKWCPCLNGLPTQIGFLTALKELILIHGFSVRYLPESIANLRLLSRLVLEDTGLVELPDTISRLADLECLSLVNCTSLKSLPDAVGELNSLTQLDLSGTTFKKLPPSLWKLQDLTLQINSSNIRTKQMRDLPLLEDVREVPLKEVKRQLRMSYDTLDCEVEQELRMSYDTLVYVAKQIFLDIACFFVNKKITNAMYMWKACHFSPEFGVRVLIKKSLIKIVDHDKIWMDDEVRDFGRKIVRQENIKNTGDQSRLWIPEMTMDRVREGPENVEPLTLWKLRHNLTHEDFANLTNARFLELDGQNFVVDFKNVLSELRWLFWRNCPPKFQANNFILNHLVVLKLSGDITTEAWSRWVEIMVPSKLKVLNLAGSKSFIETPRFFEFMRLERLILKDMPNLVNIDHSIGKLKRLIYLKIKSCPCLRELPQEIGCLTALRELVLIQCFSVRYLPYSIGNLRLLSRLIMEDTGLVELPDTIKGLMDLKHLSLVNCRSLSSLSDAIGDLESLIHLDLSGTTIKELPCSLWNLKALKTSINDSKIQTELMKYRFLMRKFENHLGPGDDRFEGAMISVRLPDYPMEILNHRSRATGAFHDRHILGRSPKISVRVIFSRDHNSWINIAAEVPLWTSMTGTTSQPIRYFKNLILMLVSWLERKRVSKRMHNLQRKDEELLSLIFCDLCMSIISETREFRDSPSMESFDRFQFTQPSIVISMTIYDSGHSGMIGCREENLEISTKCSSPILRSTPLLLKGPLSGQKLVDSIEMCKFWDEEATRFQGLFSIRSFENYTSYRRRKTRRGRLQAKRKRNLTWLSLHSYIDKSLLVCTACVCIGCCVLSPLRRTKLDYCNYALEEAWPLLDSTLDVKLKTCLARKFIRVAIWLNLLIEIEITLEEGDKQFWDDVCTLLLHWYHRNRKGGHHRLRMQISKSSPNCEGHSSC